MSHEPARPKYQRIADDLRASIDRGEYQPGDRLPGENSLAADFGVAPLTVRQALGLLRAEGLVDSRKGSGVFVQSFRPIRRRGIHRLRRDGWGSGQTIWSADDDRSPDVDQINVHEDVAPPEHIARVLGLADEETSCVRGRRYSMDGRPVMLATSYLPQTLVAGSPITQAETGPGGIYARLADLGHEPVRFREEIRSRMPTGEEAARLSIPADRTVLKLVRTAFDAEGRVVEINDMTLDSAAYVLDYEFDA
ncbi:GntR family transcriptional regulator [Actinacidiphila paucisporea]|uniref:GntR family transcriptional regulator n=1 Tax=Actinacidiphila paucisporea TaxID=310782 RepID=UPI000937D302|nr:GntR family transcriptional regulator [Actinacidiphila paucisporea]